MDSFRAHGTSRSSCFEDLTRRKFFLRAYCGKSYRLTFIAFQQIYFLLPYILEFKHALRHLLEHILQRDLLEAKEPFLAMTIYLARGMLAAQLDNKEQPCNLSTFSFFILLLFISLYWGSNFLQHCSFFAQPQSAQLPAICQIKIQATLQHFNIQR